MGHILFGLPEISQFHLHSRLARKLMTREHRVTVLAGDPVIFEFYCHQGLACRDLRPSWRPPTHQVPMAEFAAINCQLRGYRNPRQGRVQRACVPLERRLEPLLRVLDSDPPDLLLLANGRSGLHRLLHFLAVERGIKVLHLGDGLLPLTMQIDAEGIDGDSSFCRAHSQDYRRSQADEKFLAAATASWLGRAHPPPLARVGISIPPLLGRAMATAQAMVRGQWGAAWNGLTAWESAHDLRWPTLIHDPNLPDAPYVVLLLQPPDDPRLRLDHATEVDVRCLIEQTRQAVRRLDPAARTIVVEASEIAWWARRASWPDDLVFVAPGAAPVAIATAMAVVSINHPLGLAGILTDTPVLHLGRSPYGIRGVSYHSSLDRLNADLERALGDGPSHLRKRFLTRILKDHHIWCPSALPDSNGVAGLVQRLEHCLGSRGSKPLRYRPGPVWPLAR